MSFATDLFLPSGTYDLINEANQQSVTCSDNQGHDYGRLTASGAGSKWSITLLSEKKWIIQSSAENVSPALPPDPEEGDDLLLQPYQRQPHLWVIKRRKNSSNSYIIYSPKQPDLFWSIPGVSDGSQVTLSRGGNEMSSWWSFRKIEDESDLQQEILSVERPIHSAIVENKVTLVIPAGWRISISAISFGECLNLIRINRVVNRVMEKQSFISGWDTTEQPMVIHENGMNAYAAPAHAEPSVFVFEFFHSKNKRTRDPLSLAERGDHSLNLRITTAERSNGVKDIPDHQTFWVFDGGIPPTSSNSSPGNNALLIVQSMKDDDGIDYVDPGNPAPGTTNPGFNDVLDMPRPDSIDAYLSNYDIIFIIDDSSSMRGARWAEVRRALLQLSKEAMQYDADGMDVVFLNSKMHKESIADPAEMLAIFDMVQPRGWTYTGAKLKVILDRALKRLDDAVGTPGYADIKPVDIVVLTDGAPTDDPAAVIAEAIERLEMGKHHLNAVGIQFVQIGDEDGAREALTSLMNCPIRKMVDTIPYTQALTPQRLSEILLGTLHPSIRTAIEQKTSVALRSCPICCSDDIPEYDFPRFPPTSRCQHKPLACRDCLAQHLEAQLFSQAVVLEVNCLNHPCSEKLGYDEIKQWATPECFNRYNSVAIRQRLAEDPNFVWCLNVKCDHGQTHPLAHTSPIVQCSWCFKKSCFTHQLPWHEGLTCAQFDAVRTDAADQEEAKRLIDSTTQTCTKCKQKIERSAGCDYMTCRCGHGFCWRCGATITHDEIHGSTNHLPTCPLRR
ncbi:hypothetical protein DL96DRAFT_1580767 [Flagelloscypha sp. PMI_526]|nr:hypothetical protein DL96DRAFT_1580767 [Flagelloscypha sp. PMI_526]